MSYPPPFLYVWPAMHDFGPAMHGFGPSCCSIASGSEINHSGVHNSQKKTGISFLDVIVSLDSDSEVPRSSKLRPDLVLKLQPREDVMVAGNGV